MSDENTPREEQQDYEEPSLTDLEDVAGGNDAEHTCITGGSVNADFSDGS